MIGLVKKGILERGMEGVKSLFTFSRAYSHDHARQILVERSASDKFLVTRKSGLTCL